VEKWAKYADLHRAIDQTLVMRLVPGVLVDLLPVDWWKPGNLRQVGDHSLHFCADDHVRTIEWDDRVVAQGRKLFPYGRWDEPTPG
jgi:hypothetical protein